MNLCTYGSAAVCTVCARMSYYVVTYATYIYTYVCIYRMYLVFATWVVINEWCFPIFQYVHTLHVCMYVLA